MTISSSSTTSIRGALIDAPAVFGPAAPPAEGRRGTRNPSRACSLHPDCPAVGPDDPVADGQSQPGSLAHVLRGEERIEYPLQVLLRNPAAGIDDRDFHHRHRLPARFRAHGLRATAAPDGDTAFVLASIACWALTSMFMMTCLIRSASIQTCGRAGSRSMTISMLPRCAGPSIRRAVSSITLLRSTNFFRLLLAGEIEQPPDDRRASLGFPDHQIHVLRLLASVGHLFPHEVREREHAGQRVVQFMCDSGGEQPDRSQLFALRGLGLGDAELLCPFFHFLLQRAAPLPQLRLRISEGHGHGVEGCCKLAEFVRAAHRDRLFEVPPGHSLGAGFEVAQRHIDQAVHEEADDQRCEGDESGGKRGDGGGIAPHVAIDAVERIDDVQHAEDGLRVLCTWQAAL